MIGKEDQAAKTIGRLLVGDGLIDEAMLTYAMKVQTVSRERLGDTLLRLRFVTDRDIASVVARQAGLEFDPMMVVSSTPEALAQIPSAFAQKHGLLPLAIEDGHLVVACVDPYARNALDRVSRFTSYPLRLVVAPEARLRWEVQRLYQLAERHIDQEIERISQSAASGQEIVAERLMELLVSSAIEYDGTDIHLNPTERATLVSFRMDGVLQLRYTLPASVHGRLISAFKVAAGMDIAESHRPSDGHMSFTYLQEKYDLRISTIPSVVGENMVIRVLSGSHEFRSLEDLGLTPEQIERTTDMSHSPHGIVLVSGPTGSGKTTTLYAVMRTINAREKNILTIEDPVEYTMPLVQQIEVNEKAGITFTSSIRSFLRQDPDIMLIGEIRDEETAVLSMRAALTGHLVFSTVHTNDAVGAVVRLRDLGVEDYIIASTIRGVVSQRLLRLLCPHCKRPSSLEEPWNDIPPEKIFEHVGCPQCRETGYLGRTAIAEVLQMDQSLLHLIGEGASISEIEMAAKGHGMRTLSDAGQDLVADGLTDIDEFKRVL
ncbi:MAG: ATPase, T2SS/T4P/T4SS family [Candidatus Sedimenticola sp. (ex Thyasira tokunagai)]